MQSKAMNPRQIDACPPDGTYAGTWSGYEVAFSADGLRYKADTQVGIRGMDVPCEVTVINGEITIQAN